MAKPEILARLQELTGLAIVPGTLNVRLRQPVDRSPIWRYLSSADIAPDWEAEVGQAGYFWVPVRVAGRYQGLAAQADEPGYPAELVELLCEVHLRESLGLANGDDITFSVEC